MSIEMRLQLAVILNGRSLITQAATLDELLAECDFADARVATALNGEFVPLRERSAARLRPGDRIEVVSPRHGG